MDDRAAQSLERIETLLIRAHPEDVGRGFRALLLWRSGAEDEASLAHLGDPSPPFVLQMLEHIKLKEVTSRQSWSDDDCFQVLKNALEQRDLAGSPLKEVTVKACRNVYDKNLEELRQLKSLKVRWDGQVYGSASDDCGWLY